jgi:hypothetical protein
MKKNKFYVNNKYILIGYVYGKNALLWRKLWLTVNMLRFSLLHRDKQNLIPKPKSLGIFHSSAFRIFFPILFLNKIFSKFGSNDDYFKSIMKK